MNPACWLSSSLSTLLRSISKSPNHSHAVPRPYHAARLMRARAQEKIHGMVQIVKGLGAQTTLGRTGADW